MKTRLLVAASFLDGLACSSPRAGMDAGAGAAGGSAGTSDAGGIEDSSSEDRPAAQEAPLCDGEEHLRFWALLGEGGQEPAGSYVRIENGSPAFTVDGTCAYWASGGWTEDGLGRDRAVRTGRLSDEDVRSIEAHVAFADVTAVADCPPPPPGSFDYSTRVIRTKMAMAACPGTAGARFDAAWTTVQTIAARLWQTGSPVDGALHVSVIGPVSPPATHTSPPPYTWPLAQPLASFMLDSADWFRTGVSQPVNDPALARQLRAMRDQYLADRAAQPGLFSNWDGLYASDQTTTALVYMRDAFPYEDLQGLLTF